MIRRTTSNAVEKVSSAFFVFSVSLIFHSGLFVCDAPAPNWAVTVWAVCSTAAAISGDRPSPEVKSVPSIP
jgi:hypothetical protein